MGCATGGSAVGQVMDDFLAAHAVHVVHTLVHRYRQFFILPPRFYIKLYSPHHHAVLAQYFSQFAGIDACNARYLLTLQPVAEAFHGIPMAVIFGIVTYDNGFGMDVFTLHECRQPVWLDGERRYTVVARQRISERHQLAGV